MSAAMKRTDYSNAETAIVAHIMRCDYLVWTAWIHRAKQEYLSHTDRAADDNFFWTVSWMATSLENNIRASSECEGKFGAALMECALRRVAWWEIAWDFCRAVGLAPKEFYEPQ